MSNRITQNSGSGDPLTRILDSIDRGLSVFGEDVKIAIYWILENEYKMRRRDSVIKPELFASSLRKVFGVGTKVVERKIVEQIRASFGIPTAAGEDLVSIINHAKTVMREI